MHSKRACPAKYCKQGEQREDAVTPTKRACPGKYCEQDCPTDDNDIQNQTRDGVSGRIGRGGGTQPIFGGSPTIGSLYVVDLGEFVEENSGKDSCEEGKLERDSGDEAIVNGTSSISLPMKH